MITRGILLLSAGLMFAASPVHAGDAGAGKAKSERCATCHGEDGKGDPAIAGMDEAKFIGALKAFKSGERNNKKMMKITAEMSDADMADLAAYYSSLK
jgi:cytochrome c553